MATQQKHTHHINLSETETQLEMSADPYSPAPADDFNLVATNELDEVAMSTPAIARGSLFIRTRGHLYRLSNADAAESEAGD